ETRWSSVSEHHSATKCIETPYLDTIKVMEEKQEQLMLSGEALKLLDTLDESLPNPLAPDALLTTVNKLRNKGHDPELVATVLSQLKLRRKAAGKFGEFAQRMLFTEAGLEQATRLNVAAHHAGRFEAQGFKN